jgi:uncharacterized protein (DUF1684 family)
MRSILILVFVPLAFSAAGGGSGYPEWRANYEASLRAPDGWLSVAGLIWLHEGTNSVELPKKTITLRLDSGKVFFEKRQVRSDATDNPDVLKFGEVTLTIIERGGKTGVRVRDPNAETRRDFTGCNWFPADAAWRVNAKWVSSPKPKTIAITNILGMTDQEPSPGLAEFTLQGKKMTLEPVLEDGELFFMFKDATSAKTTYGAGRFLYAALPKGNEVELDFNKAHNPPCAFTAFATCPLPPKQNILSAAIDAGEKSYGHH